MFPHNISHLLVTPLYLDSLNMMVSYLESENLTTAVYSFGAFVSYTEGCISRLGLAVRFHESHTRAFKRTRVDSIHSKVCLIVQLTL